MMRSVAVAALLSLSLLVSPVWPEESVAYTYDDAGRLIAVNYGKGQGISYTYDAAGNMLSRTIVVFPDGDGDGLDDNWENANFGGTNRNGAADLDMDGMSDAAEFLAGTSPTNAASRLVFSTSPPPGGSGHTILWDSVADRAYQVQFKDSLFDVAWHDLGMPLVATGAVSSVQDPAAASRTNRYYRIQLVPSL